MNQLNAPDSDLDSISLRMMINSEGSQSLKNEISAKFRNFKILNQSFTDTDFIDEKAIIIVMIESEIGSALQIIKNINSRNHQTGILIVSSRKLNNEERVQLMEAGADNLVHDEIDLELVYLMIKNLWRRIQIN